MAKFEDIKGGNNNRFLTSQVLFSNKSPNQKMYEVLDIYKNTLNTLDPSLYYVYLEWKESMLTMKNITPIEYK